MQRLEVRSESGKTLLWIFADNNPQMNYNFEKFKNTKMLYDVGRVLKGRH